MASKYKLNKRKVLKEAIAEAREELERLEQALESAETMSYDEYEDPERARRAWIGTFLDDIRFNLDQTRTYYDDLATTY